MIPIIQKWRKRSVIAIIVIHEDPNYTYLRHTHTVKYLGVTLSSKLTWSEHITNISKAAKRQIGLIPRQLHQAPVDVRRKIVQTTILPKLEYCSAVWDPHQKQDIARLDSAQQFAGRMVLRNWTTGTDELLATLRWSLNVRRRNIKLKVLYNVLNNNSRIPQSTFTFHPRPSPCHTHNRKLFQPFVSTLLSSLFLHRCYPYLELPIFIYCQ